MMYVITPNTNEINAALPHFPESFLRASARVCDAVIKNPPLLFIYMFDYSYAKK